MPASLAPSARPDPVSAQQPRRWWRTREAFVGAAYFALHLLAHTSASLFAVTPGVSLWYPPAGLALSLLVLLGPRYAPLVLAANIAGAWLTSDFGLNWSILIFPALITTIYTATAFLARRQVGPKLLPGTPRETAVFVAGTLLAPACVACCGMGVLAQLEPITTHTLIRGFVQWWLGDASGMITIVPLVMVFAGPWVRGEPLTIQPIPRVPYRIVFTTLRVAALLGSLWLVFAVAALPHTLTFYLCILPLVWICLRHGLPGATLATLGITMGGLLGMRLVDGTMESASAFLFLELVCAVVGLGLGSSVTRRTVAERRLAANEALLDRVISGAQVGLWDWDLQTDRTTCNRLCAQMLGLPPSALAITPAMWLQQIHPDDRARVETELRRHLAGRSSLFETEYRLRPLDSTERWIHARGSVVAHDSKGRPLRLSGTKIDITDRKLAETEARRLLQVVEATTDLIVTTDTTGRILYANAAFLHFLDCTDLSSFRGQHLRAILPPASWEAFAPVLALLPDTAAWTGEITFANRTGTALPISLVALRHEGGNGTVDSFSFVLHDLSKQKEAETARLEQERRLLRLQKSESLGVLAGGIAHDFNNLLTAMLGNASLARLELPEQSPLHEPINQIELAANRAAELCQQMLAYAGRRSLAAREVDFNKLIDQTQRLVIASISRKIAVSIDYCPESVVVHAEPPQLQQVILNLVINAAEAIGDQPGRITIRSTRRYFTPGELLADFGTDRLPAGSYALCEVADTGKGIAPELRQRIFEPFFSTKTTGHGLGLAAVHGIVLSHRGAITVVSTPGQGSTFRIILPLSGVQETPVSAPTPARPWNTSGLALVVDDEATVQAVAAQLLKSFGFTTLVAADGVEAVNLFQQYAAHLRLVLLDVIMPRLDGVETLRELRRINPAVPVVMMSGYDADQKFDALAALKPEGRIAKPFSRDALRERLEALLGRD